MRHITLLLVGLTLAACGRDRAPTEKPATADSTAKHDSVAAEAGASGVFYTLQGDSAVGRLDGPVWKAGHKLAYLALSSDGKYIAASAPDDSAVVVLDARSGELLETVRTGKDPKGVVFIPRSTAVLVANEGSGTVGIVGLRQGSVTEVKVGRQPHNLLIDPNGEQFYVTIQGDDRVLVLDMESMAITDTIPVPGHPHNLTIAPDGSSLYVTLLDKQQVVAFDLVKRVIRGRAPLSAPHYGIAVSPDGQWLYVTGMAGSVLNVIDSRTMERVAQVEVGLGPHGVRTNAAGDEIYVTVASTGEIVVIDATSRQVKRRVQVGRQPFWVTVRE